MEKTKVLNEKYKLAWLEYKKAGQLADEKEMDLFIKLGKKHILDEHDRLCDELEKDDSEETDQKIDQLIIEHDTIIEKASFKEKYDWNNALAKVDEALDSVEKAWKAYEKSKKGDEST